MTEPVSAPAHAAAPPPLLPRPSHWRPFALRAAFTAALLAGLLVWLPADELWEAMRRTGLGLWVLLLVATSAGHAVAAFKWSVLLRASGVTAPFREVLAAHGSGLFANIWLPSLVGGDVVRAGVLARREGRLAPPAAATVADRVADTLALVLLAGLGLAWLPEARSLSAWRILEGSAGLVALLGVLVVAALRLGPPRWTGRRGERVVARLRDAVHALLEQPAAALRALALSLLVQGGFVALNLPLAAAIGIDVPPAAWLLVWPLAKLAALVPVSLGGIGVREVAQTALLAPLGVPPTLAVAQSLLWQSLVLATGLVAGAAALVLRRRWAAAASAARRRAASSGTAATERRESRPLA